MATLTRLLIGLEEKLQGPQDIPKDLILSQLSAAVNVVDSLSRAWTDSVGLASVSAFNLLLAHRDATLSLAVPQLDRAMRDELRHEPFSTLLFNDVLRSSDFLHRFRERAQEKVLVNLASSAKSTPPKRESGNSRQRSSKRSRSRTQSSQRIVKRPRSDSDARSKAPKPKSGKNTSDSFTYNKTSKQSR